MKFGIKLWNRGPLSSAQGMIRMAQRADALGVDAVFVADHIVLPKAIPSNYPYDPKGERSWENARNYYESLTTLTYLAGKTERIRLGVSVLILPYRNPILTAKILACMDSLSGGRIILGVGTGWWEDEFKALGIGDHFADRGARTDEYIRIFKTLWCEDDPVFQGTYHQFSHIDFSPKPVQRPGIPIWIGGNSKRAMRRAVELGDAWHPVGLRPPAKLDPLELGQMAAELHALAEKAGRDRKSLEIALRFPLHIGSPQRDYLRGTSEQVVEDIETFARGGMTHVTFDLTGSSIAENLEQLERLAEEVMPHFAGNP